MKIFLTNLLLCAAITLIAIGVHTSSFMPAGIGGICVGIYNIIIDLPD